MRPLAAGVAVAGLLFASAVLLMTPTGPAQELPQPEAAAPEPAVAPPPRPDASVSRMRRIAPELDLLSGIDPAALERVEVPAPAPAARSRVAHDGSLKEKLLYRPLAIGAGIFQAQGYRVTLAGIEPTASEEMCGSGISEWPCGVHARTAFRNWLRGRALTCLVPPTPPQDEAVTAECRLGNQDPAEWLVAQGWARATPGGPFADLGALAEQEEMGVFGTAPIATLPLTSAPSVTSGG